MNMKKIEVLVELSYTKTILVELEENENAERKAMEIVDEMTNEEYEEFLQTCRHDVYVEEQTIEAQVKKAIDRFDPYGLMPGQDAPADEYDGESRRIVEKIKPTMSMEEIADIIAKEFTRSFNSEFTEEYCISPAFEIYRYLMKQVYASN
jgi:hypothetical protein